MNNINQLIGEQIKLPSAPLIIQKLQTLVTNDDVGTAEIARIVEIDQGFSARILKLVNSPFYGLSQKVTSVTDAIKIVGTKAVHQLLLATSVMSSFGDEYAGINADSFWLHSFGVGVLAKHLIRDANSEVKSETLSAGILHDIGRLVLAGSDPKRFAVVFRESDMVCDLNREKSFFGVDHQEIGGQLAEKWNFPESIVMTIKYHHSPQQAPNHKKLISAVNIANLLCHAFKIGDSGISFVSEFDPENWNILELGYEDLQGIFICAFNELEETRSHLTS